MSRFPFKMIAGAADASRYVPGFKMSFLVRCIGYEAVLRAEVVRTQPAHEGRVWVSWEFPDLPEVFRERTRAPLRISGNVAQVLRGR